jgi:hypothetical protein
MMINSNKIDSRGISHLIKANFKNLKKLVLSTFPLTLGNNNIG